MRPKAPRRLRTPWKETMVSSKFSRRPVVQQPPPVCKSKKKPIIIPPPPPPPHNTLRLDATWHGIDSFDIWRDLEESVELQPSYPDPGNVYAYSREGSDPWFDVWLTIVGTNLSGYYEWGGYPGWNCAASFAREIDPNVPLDTGILDADSTMPPDQASTYRLYSAYTTP